MDSLKMALNLSSDSVNASSALLLSVMSLMLHWITFALSIKKTSVSMLRPFWVVSGVSW